MDQIASTKTTPKILKQLTNLLTEFNGKPITINILNEGVKVIQGKNRIYRMQAYLFKTEQEITKFFSKIKETVTHIYILPNYVVNSLYWGEPNCYNIMACFFPFSEEAEARIQNRGGMGSEPNKIYKYNYLSFIEGGASVAVVFNNKRVSIRHNVKFSSSYINKIMKSPDVFTAFKITE